VGDHCASNLRYDSDMIRFCSLLLLQMNDLKAQQLIFSRLVRWGCTLTDIHIDNQASERPLSQ
jgi:hypothetical protein